MYLQKSYSAIPLSKPHNCLLSYHLVWLTVFFLQYTSDLLQLGGSTPYKNGNPFSKDVNSTENFAEHVFDPFASKTPEINQNTIQVGFHLQTISFTSIYC